MKNLLTAVLLVSSSFVFAEEVTNSQENSEPPKIGVVTAQLLKAQAEGKFASDNPQSATPVIQEKAIERHLHTYTHQIPDFYERDAFVSSGN